MWHQLLLFLTGFSDLVALFSGVARTIRAAATAAGLQLVSSLVHIAKVKAETRDMKQRQLMLKEKETTECSYIENLEGSLGSYTSSDS